LTHDHDDHAEAGPRHFFGVVPVFLVDDVTAAAEHYRDALGFDIDFLWGEPPTYAGVSRDDAVIHLRLSQPSGRRNSVAAAGYGNGVDALIVVSALDELFAELKQRGARLLSEPADQPYGMREFEVEDLNGYRLLLTEELEEDPQ